MNIRYLLTKSILSIMVMFTMFACQNKVSPPGRQIYPEVSVTITSPADGDFISRTDDVNNGIDGIQINITATITGLEEDDTAYLTNSAKPSASPIGVIVANQSISFSNYTLELGENTITIQAENKGEKQGSDQITIQVSESGAVCYFSSPNDNQTLTVDENDTLDHFQATINLYCIGDNIAEGTPIYLSTNGRRPSVSNLTADLTVAFTDFALAEGMNELVYGINEHPPSLASQTCADLFPGCITVTVDTGRCTASIQPIDGSSLLYIDDNNLSYVDGLQHDIRVITDCSTDTTIELSIGDSAANLSVVTQTYEVQDLGSSRIFTFRDLSLSPAGSENALNAVVDAKLLQGVSPGTLVGHALPSLYIVDAYPPTFSQVFPANNEVISYALDSSTDDGLQIHVYGIVHGLEEGGAIQLAVVPQGDPGSNATWMTTQRKANYTFDFWEVPVSDGDYDILLFAQDVAGNIGEVRISITVSDDQPIARIIAPAEGTILTLSDDISAPQVGIQYNVTVQAENFLAKHNPQATVFVSGFSPVTFDVTPNVPTSSRFSFTEDGSYTVYVVIEDQIGNLAQSNTVNFAVDANPPQVTWTMQSNDGNRYFTNNEVVTGSDSMIGADIAIEINEDDTYTVTVNRQNASGADWNSASTPVAGNAGGITISSILLLEGQNTITVNVEDAAGNQYSTSKIIYYDSTAPQAAFGTLDLVTDLNGATPILDTTIPVNVSADADGSSEPLNSWISADLYWYDSFSSFDGQSHLLASLSSQYTGSNFTFNFAVSLPEGIYDLVAVIVDQIGNTTTISAPGVNINNSAIDIIVTAPSSNTCMSGNALNISAEYSSIYSSDCSLTYAGGTIGSAVASSSFPLVNQSFDISSLASNDFYSLWLYCDDGGSNSGQSQTISLFLDDSSPLFDSNAGFAAPIPGTSVNADSVDTTTQPGIQSDVVINAQLDSSQAENESALVGHINVAFESDGFTDSSLYATSLPYPTATGIFTFSNVTLVPEGQTTGLISITFSLEDCAGNITNLPVQTYDVGLIPPVVIQDRPNPSITVLDDDQVAGAEGLQDYFTYYASPLAEGSSGYLVIDPLPLNKTSGDMPLVLASSDNIANNRSDFDFGLLGFDNGYYFADFYVIDKYGNIVHADPYYFQVQLIIEKIELQSPTNNAVFTSSQDKDPVAAGLQADIIGTVVGYSAGTTARLCSDHADVTGADCDNGGRTLATTVNQGTLSFSSVTFSNITFPEGSHNIYLEISTLGSSSHTNTINIFVDSLGPVVASYTLPNNKVNNDDSLINLSASEGSVDGSNFSTPITVQLTDTEPGSPVYVYSNKPLPDTLIGTGNAGTESGGFYPATFNIMLRSGTQTLTIVGADARGNTSVVADQITVNTLVDFRPGTVTIANPSQSPYTSVHGTINTYGTSDTSDDTLTIQVVVSVSDDQAVDGGSLRLYRNYGQPDEYYADYILTSPANSQAVPFSLPLHQGNTLALTSNNLRAVFADALGNTITTYDILGSDVTYEIDYLGPQLVLLPALDNAGDDCSSDAPCRVDYFDPFNPGGGRTTGYAYLENQNIDDSYTDIPGTLGSDLMVIAEGCQCNVRLLSRIHGSSSDYNQVLNSSLLLSDATSDTYYNLDINHYGPGFLPGNIREVVLSGEDEYGNESYADPLFLEFNYISNALVFAERLSPSMVIGPVIGDGDYFGAADDATVGTPFTTNVHVVADGFGILNSDLDGATATLHIDGGTLTYTSSQILTSSGGNEYTADFLDVPMMNTVALVNTYYHTMTITVSNNGSELGTRILTNLVADLDGCTFEWNRSILQTYLASDGTDIIPATWNAALDALLGDGDPSNGMNTSTPPIALTLYNIENGQLVTLNTNQGSLEGTYQVITSGCVAGTCTVTFGDLQVPSLLNNGTHNITVSVSDRAGNPAPASVVSAETLIVTVDTVAPDSTKPTVCIGEDLTPYSTDNSITKRDPYQEPVSCSTYCGTNGCNRRNGTVTLAWNASYDDAGNGDISHYIVGYQALGQRTTYLADCNDIAAYNDLDANSGSLDYQEIVPYQAGSVISHQLENLVTHWDYCFVVQAVDDAGNVASVDGFTTRRPLPLRSWPRKAPFDGLASKDGRDSGRAFYPFDPTNDPDGASEGPGVGYGLQMTNIGDMDGDGLPDLAVSNRLYPDGDELGIVHLFFSGNNSINPNLSREPDAIISIPGLVAGTDRAGLGYFIAPAGMIDGTTWRNNDLNGDGLADLVISAPLADYWAGRVFVYFGSPVIGIENYDAGDFKAGETEPQPTVTFMSDGFGWPMGWPVAIGNVNGDDYQDLIFGNVYNGSLGIYYGGPNFPTGISAGNEVVTVHMYDGSFVLQADENDVSIPDSTVKLTDYDISGAFPDVITVGDFNDDGTDDLALTHYIDADEQNILLIAGPILPGTPLEITTSIETIPVPSGLTLSSNAYHAFNLWAIDSPVSSSDHDWLFVRTRQSQSPTLDSSYITVYKGQSGSTIIDQSVSYNLDRTDFSGTTLQGFGRSFAYLGDIDNDNRPEFAVGAARSSNNSSATQGAVVIFELVEDSSETFGYRFDKQAIIYGEALATGSGFGTTLTNIGDFFGLGMENMLMVSDTTYNQGQLYLYW